MRFIRLYNKFLTLKSLLESESEREKLIKYIRETSGHSFASFLDGDLIKNNYGRITKYLKKDYYLILTKIRIASFTSKQLVVTTAEKGVLISIDELPLYSGSIANNLFEGKGVLYTEEGLPKFEGVFVKGRFVSGNVKEYYETGAVLFEIEYDGDVKKRGYMVKANSDQERVPYYFQGEFINGEISHGIVTRFGDNHLIKYEGELRDGVYSGYGILYSKGTVRYEGEFSEGNIIKGEEFGEKGFYFKGVFRNSRPWIGEVTNFSNRYTREFTGFLKDGNPYNGTGLVFQVDLEGKDRGYYESEEERYVNYIEEEYNYHEEEKQQELINQMDREGSRRWENFIRADWNKGEVEEWEDKEINKRVYVG